MATPLPAIRMPVWPVARKSASTPRRRNSRSITSAAYFLPTEQSVPHRQEAFPRAPVAGAGLEPPVCMADVEQLTTVDPRRIGHLRKGCEPGVQATRHIQPAPEGLHDHRGPRSRQHAARVDRADHQGFRTPCSARADRQFGNAQVRPTPGQAKLTQGPLRPPVDDSLPGLSRQLVFGIADEDQVWGLNVQINLPRLSRHLQQPPPQLLKRQFTEPASAYQSPEASEGRALQAVNSALACCRALP